MFNSIQQTLNPKRPTKKSEQVKVVKTSALLLDDQRPTREQLLAELAEYDSAKKTSQSPGAFPCIAEMFGGKNTQKYTDINKNQCPAHVCRGQSPKVGGQFSSIAKRFGVERKTDKPIPVEYGSYQWKQMRQEKLKASPTCEMCCAKPSEHIDHIQPVADGGDFFDRSNLQALCRSCHTSKTHKDIGNNTPSLSNAKSPMSNAKSAQKAVTMLQKLGETVDTATSKLEKLGVATSDPHSSRELESLKRRIEELESRTPEALAKKREEVERANFLAKLEKQSGENNRAIARVVLSGSGIGARLNCGSGKIW